LLARAGVLTVGEQEQFGAALWSIRDASIERLPANTRLLATAFVHTPAPAEIDREALVRAHLFGGNVAEILAEPKPLGSIDVGNKLNRLAELSAANGAGLIPTREQAARLFAEITSWAAAVEKKLSETNTFVDPFRQQTRERLLSHAASALARLVVPSLAPEDRTEKRANELLAFIKDPSTSTALPALPYFAHLPVVRPEIVRRIRRAIAGRHFEEVAGGAMAIEKWASLFAPESAEGLPDQLIEHLISSIETGQSVGLHALLLCARKLLELHWLRVRDAPRLEEVLGDLIVATSYEAIDFESKKAVSISLVRAECVRLAHALKVDGASGTNAEAWLTTANSDPLPEVRFAHHE
jgi:hypothetical protein